MTTLPPFEDQDIGMARSWLKGFVRKVAPSTVHPDDLEAEGLIAMWQAYGKLTEVKGSLDSYLIQAAKWHVLRVLDRRKWTGQEKTPAPRGVNSRGVVHPDQVEQTYPDDVLRDWSETAFEEPGYTTSDITDVRAEVRRAVAELPASQRERIFKKFWLTESVPLSGGWWRDPKYGVKARLACDLAHLASVI